MVVFVVFFLTGCDRNPPVDARGMLDPAPSAYVRGGRCQHGDRCPDDPNGSVAQLSGRIANDTKGTRKDTAFGGRVQEVH